MTRQAPLEQLKPDGSNRDRVLKGLIEAVSRLRGDVGDPNDNAATIRDLETLESNNFVEGRSGWRIRKNGDAEFNAGVFRGLLEFAKISAPNLQIKSIRQPVYGPPVSVLSDWNIYSGGTTANSIYLGQMYLPGSTNTSLKKISTKNGAYIIVSGLIQFRDSEWRTQYRVNGGSWTFLDDAPIINHVGNADAEIFAWSFGIDLWSIANPEDETIEFRLVETETGSEAHFNSYRFVMSYSNL